MLVALYYFKSKTMGLNPVEIIKKLPRTNCKECGYPTCLAFAMAVVTGACEPAKCPYFSPENWPEVKQKVSLEEDYAWRILEEVKKKVQKIDLEKVAPSLGASFENGWLKLPFLDTEVLLNASRARRLDGKDLDPRDQILLYNYFIFAGKVPLKGEFVGLESFPSSLSKTVTLRRYAEEKLGEAFSGRLNSLKKALSFLKTEEPKECPADLCAIVYVLPRVPLKVHFFEAEPEENLPPEVKILFDANATAYLDLESLVFCAERLVERLIELAEEE
ncbi:DUF3786 domain-containing protein [Thermodesulfatator autotrophicus]|uniref:4Fe-4S domain-containing protein n=1 Tax=Thermodesulfatator autotrophicus TaxID=1795632 RepID=A0A177E6L5_9BACT|nr:DUF3786 domain-containing protein [Thermodesulfatator autotrophicus]OAG27587.1 hypothetical protein TH606_06000 [Thermodesulfatator autotrophicus]